MDTFALKLVLTPALIGAASLVGRRFGPAVSGWLVGLPFTSGPVSLFLALEQGAGFAASAAVGTLLGTAAQAGFSLAYASVGARAAWPVALAVGSLGFAALGLALEWLAPSPLAATVIAIGTLGVALGLMPRRPAAAGREVRRPRWDLPGRMVVATAVVLALTTLAPRLGPRVT